MLSFHPQHDVRAIVRQLVNERSRFSDWKNPSYYNIRVFRALENGIGSHTLGEVVAVAQ